MSGAAPDPSIRILLVGGQPLFVKALQTRLRQSRLHVVGVECGSEDVAAHAQTLAADVVLLDADPSGEAIDAASRIMAQESPPKVIVLTDERSQIDTAQAQRAGAVAFVRKPAAIDDLVETLELVVTLLVDTSRAQSGC
jgi:two-component system sensor histidine kinase EvgS/two-component system response regulator EvgA